MPVLDWARTDLNHPNPNGSTNLYFSRAQFAYFDIHILKREGAERDWDEATLAEVAKLKATLTPEDDAKLVDSIIVKTQGFVSGNISEDEERPVELFRQLLSLYEGIDKARLRENMRYFLSAIMPTCEEYGMNMCVHPDDPPFPILGLPRIVTCDEDIDWFLHAVTIPTTASPSAPAACRRVPTTTWWPWPASTPAARGSSTCAAATCSPTATSPRPATWVAGRTSSSWPASSRRPIPSCPCAWTTA